MPFFGRMVLAGGVFWAIIPASRWALRAWVVFFLVAILFWLLMIAIEILGFIALMVGILVAVPVIWLAITYVYRQLNPASTPANRGVDHGDLVMNLGPGA